LLVAAQKSDRLQIQNDNDNTGDCTDEEKPECPADESSSGPFRFLAFEPRFTTSWVSLLDPITNYV
jgi:hypothetical protein